MATIERTRQPLAFGDTSTDERELPQILIDELFAQGSGWPMGSGRNVLPGADWSRISLAPEEYEDESPEAEMEVAVLRSNEVTREAVSYGVRPVVIEITDEQAVQLKRFRGI